MPNPVQFHRVLRAAPEKVYRAFLDADAMAKWLPPNGFTGKVHRLDAKVGGTYKMSFTNFSTGRSHSFGGEYLELVPHERFIILSSRAPSRDRAFAGSGTTEDEPIEQQQDTTLAVDRRALAVASSVRG